MISHVFVGVTDFDRAFMFYSAVMSALENKPRFSNPEEGWAGWQPSTEPRPLFVIGKPYNEQPHQPGNGQMVAFLAKDRATVRAVHAAALENGGLSEGEPGLRPQYHEHYYGAYFRDTEGNKLCVACHSPDD